jgi:hypothetical protein
MAVSRVHPKVAAPPQSPQRLQRCLLRIANPGDAGADGVGGGRRGLGGGAKMKLRQSSFNVALTILPALGLAIGQTLTLL